MFTYLHDDLAERNVLEAYTGLLGPSEAAPSTLRSPPPKESHRAESALVGRCDRCALQIRLTHIGEAPPLRACKLHYLLWSRSPRSSQPLVFATQDGYS